jgi:hypothetical protein
MKNTGRRSADGHHQLALVSYAETGVVQRCRRVDCGLYMCSQECTKYFFFATRPTYQVNMRSLCTGLIAVVLGLVPRPCVAVPDVCFGTGVRPVLLVPGYQGSPLYDSQKSYHIEWPDVDAFFQQYSFDEECVLASFAA